MYIRHAIRVKAIQSVNCVYFNQIRRFFHVTPLVVQSPTSGPIVKKSTLQNYLTKKCNIVLMGSPGCGKTTVGRLVAKRLGMAFVDVDDNHLEHVWGTTVAEKLEEVGSARFIEEEGNALLKLDVSNNVVSLTGSNPLHPTSMSHVSNSGLVFLLDVQKSDILNRLEKMKVNRIVGQEDGTSMSSILEYRQQFYETSYDVRVLCRENITVDEICDKVIEHVKEIECDAGFVSTRGRNQQVRYRRTFSDVILQGLAEDGGLFVPSRKIPRMSIAEWQRLLPLDYASRALQILELWFNPYDLHPSKLWKSIAATYTVESFGNEAIFPVKHLAEKQFLLELFHGPTASFKDAALQLFPLFFQEALQTNMEREIKKYMILVATSGDTGSAVLDGFSRKGGDMGVGVLVLFPEEGISDIQKTQMTSLQEKNIHVVGVCGDFDFCQSAVKRAFTDQDLASNLVHSHGCKLSAANSLNWGRLLPQVVYHASAYLSLVQKKIISLGEEIDICIPTGNFGNILSAYYAKEMGIPFRHLVCASNCNNVLTEFINTGCYDLQSRTLQPTASPAIDILVSSNLERFLYHLTEGSSDQITQWYQSLKENSFFTVPPEVLEQIQKVMVADWCSEAECRETIEKTYRDTGYLLDPHTAVGKTIGDRFYTGERPMIIAATAHYGKFADTVFDAIGYEAGKEKSAQELLEFFDNLKLKPPMHEMLMKTSAKPRTQKIVCDADYSNIVEQIYQFTKLL